MAAGSTASGRRRRWPAWLTPTLFLLPALSVYVMFLVVPTLSTLWVSLLDWDGLSAQWRFVGLDNYAQLLAGDAVARTALWNTVIWTVASLLLPTSAGLALALALNRRVPGTALLRTIFYCPGVLPMVAVGLIWSWMYNPHFGAVNVLLRAVRLGSLAGGWLSDYATAFAAVFVTAMWAGVGLPMVLYLAGLQAIPPEQHEAARIDGANAWQDFRHVTMPGLTETHVVVLSLSVIGAVRAFDLIYTMTYGGPGRATQVLGTWMYFQTFQYYHVGYGAAVAWVIAAITLAIAIPYIRRMSRT